MTDNTIVIQSIHPEAKKMVVVFNVEGKTFPKVLPFLTTQDAELLKQQLKDFATELKGEFEDLKKAVQEADANAVPAVSDSVTALTGQEIAIDSTQATDTTPAQPDPNATANTEEAKA